MVYHRASLLFRNTNTFVSLQNAERRQNVQLRGAVTTPSGAIPPEPKRTPFGFLGVICSIASGLLIGATLSKMIANFLEEKELFVPSDDDDDDD